MQKVLVVCDSEMTKAELTRSRARGHKRLVLKEGVEPFSPITMKTEGTDLVIEAVEHNGEDECYTILCKEFGLFGFRRNLRSKISVIFCDNGLMAVTLYQGGLVINVDGNLVMPTAGEFDTESCDTDSILWVNAEKLLAYSKYLDDKEHFMYDIEFMFEVRGDNSYNNESFGMRHIGAEDIDISLGYIAQWQQQRLLDAQQKRINSFVNSLGTHSAEYEYDEPDEEEDEDSFWTDEEDEDD